MTETAETNEDQNPLTKPKFIFSAVVVALLVALGLIFALTPRGGGTAAPTTAPNNNPSAASSHAAEASGASVCGLPAGDQSKPVVPPADTKWELVGKFAAPTSPKQYGPGQTNANGLRSCFSHSPMGALYAGANIVILASSGHNDLVIQNLTIDGPKRDKMLSAPAPGGENDTPFQLAGFKLTEYSNDRAVIDYGFKVSNGTFGSLPVVLQWSDGDWKAVPPASGQPEGQQLADLSGYIPWAGV